MNETREREFQIDLDGKSYPCVLTVPGVDVKPLGVILAHGAGGDLTGGHLPNSAKKLAEAGYPCLRFTCKPVNLSTRCKVFKAVLEHATKLEEGAQITSWVFAGHSMGSRVAAVCSQEASCDVKGCIFFSYPLHPPGKPDKLRDSPLCDLTLPLMFIRGTNDLGFSQLDKFEEVKNRLHSSYIKVHEVQGGDHGLKVKGGAEANRKAMSEVYDAVMAYLEHVAVIPSESKACSKDDDEAVPETEAAGRVTGRRKVRAVSSKTKAELSRKAPKTKHTPRRTTAPPQKRRADAAAVGHRKTRKAVKES